MSDYSRTPSKEEIHDDNVREKVLGLPLSKLIEMGITLYELQGLLRINKAYSPIFSARELERLFLGKAEKPADQSDEEEIRQVEEEIHILERARDNIWLSHSWPIANRILAREQQALADLKRGMLEKDSE
jgi:hypothetical protein